jgi:enoyl-CoA hydratase
MSYENLLLDQPEPGLYLLTLNRPRALNALNAAILTEISAALDEVRADAGARVLLVTGAGDKAFVAGADIAEMQALRPCRRAPFQLTAWRSCTRSKRFRYR